MEDNLKSLVEARVTRLHEVLQENNRDVLVVGISGGVDSAVVLCLLHELQRAYRGIYAVIPVIAPISSSSGTTGQTEATTLGNQLCQQFGYIPTVVELKYVSKKVGQILNLNTDYQQQQTDYWLRPMAFYAEATKRSNAIMVSTTNYAEWCLGWFSQYLDIFGIHPIIDLHKSLVNDLAKYFNVPQAIINNSPKGGLASGETDEEALGFLYQDFETYCENPDVLVPEITYKIEKRISESEFKRFRFNKDFIFQVSL